MMIRVLFFAQVREWVGHSELTVGAEYRNVESLRAALALRGEKWQEALNQDGVLAAVNQTLVDFSAPLKDGDEVAFFPPVTGG